MRLAYNIYNSKTVLGSLLSIWEKIGAGFFMLEMLSAIGPAYRVTG